MLRKSKQKQDWCEIKPKGQFILNCDPDMCTVSRDTRNTTRKNDEGISC